jgi:hypothetical protein
MRYRKGKLGLTDFMKNKDNVNLASGVANNVSGAISAIDSGNDSVGASVASSALSGLSMGLQTGNPIAAGVGLVGGGLYGLFSAQKQKKDEFNRMVSKDENNKLTSANNTAMAYKNNPDLKGSINNSYYATGGEIDSPNVNHTNGKPLQPSFTKRLVDKGMNMLDYPHKKIIQAIGGNGNQTYSELLNERRKEKNSLYNSMDDINPKMLDYIGQAGDITIDPLMLSKVKTVKGASKLIESTNKLYKGYKVADTIGDIGSVIDFATKKGRKFAFGGDLPTIKNPYNVPTLTNIGDKRITNSTTPLTMLKDSLNTPTSNAYRMEKAGSGRRYMKKELINNANYISNQRPINIDRLNEMNNKYGKAKINFAGHLNNLSRSHYLSSLNQVNIDTLDDNNNKFRLLDSALGEMAHTKSYNDNPEGSEERKKMKGVFQSLNIKNSNDYDSKMYKTKGTEEYKAHKIIEPELHNEYIKGRAFNKEPLDYFKEAKKLPFNTINNNINVDNINNKNTLNTNITPNTQTLLPNIDVSKQQSIVNTTNTNTVTNPVKDITQEKFNPFNPPSETLNPNLYKSWVQQRSDVISGKYDEKKLGGEMNMSKDKSRYKIGGLINKKFALGGHIQQLTDKDSMIHGRSHEQGGVKFPEHGVELEGGETMNDNFVFSKQLGFADKHLGLIKQKQKFEKLVQDRPNDKSLVNSIKFTDKKIDKLKVQQEGLKQQLGLDNDNEEVQEFARGGSLFTKDELLKTDFNADEIGNVNVRENTYERPVNKQVDTSSDNLSFLAGNMSQKVNNAKIAKEVKSHLLSNGLSETAVQGILANSDRESGFNPNAIGDNGNSYGLFQHNKSRKTNLLSYLKQRGLNSNDVRGQVDFTVSELSQRGLLKSLNNAKSKEEASDIFVSKFERPANLENEKLIRRQLSNKKYAMGGLLSFKLGGIPPKKPSLNTVKVWKEYGRGTNNYSRVLEELPKEPDAIKQYKQDLEKYNDYQSKQIQKEGTLEAKRIRKEAKNPSKASINRIIDANKREIPNKSNVSDTPDFRRVEQYRQQREQEKTLKEASNRGIELDKKNQINNANEQSVKKFRDSKTAQEPQITVKTNNELIQKAIKEKAIREGQKKVIDERNAKQGVVNKEVVKTTKPAVPTGSITEKVNNPVIERNTKSTFQRIKDAPFGKGVSNIAKGLGKASAAGSALGTGLLFNEMGVFDSKKQRLAKNEQAQEEQNSGLIDKFGQPTKYSSGLDDYSNANKEERKKLIDNTRFDNYVKDKKIPVSVREKILGISGDKRSEIDRGVSQEKVKRDLQYLKNRRSNLLNTDKKASNVISTVPSNITPTTNSTTVTQRRSNTTNIVPKRKSISPNTLNPTVLNPTSSIPSMAGGDKFNVKPTMFNPDDTGIKPLTATELANQRKGQVKMLSDEELANKPKQTKTPTDLSSLGNAINIYGSDVVGLLRKYPNVPNPILNSNVALQRQNLNADRIGANQDFNNALVGSGNLSSSASAGLRGSLLASKYKMNNDISQRENNANTDISNREAGINAEINQGNNAKMNQFNEDNVNRDFAIGNNRQSYLANINDKMAQQSRDKKLDQLDKDKFEILSKSKDTGVQKEITNLLGNTNAFKRVINTKQRFGGMLKK